MFMLHWSLEILQRKRNAERVLLRRSYNQLPGAWYIYMYIYEYRHNVVEGSENIFARRGRRLIHAQLIICVRFPPCTLHQHSPSADNLSPKGRQQVKSDACCLVDKRRITATTTATVCLSHAPLQRLKFEGGGKICEINEKVETLNCEYWYLKLTKDSKLFLKNT